MRRTARRAERVQRTLLERVHLLVRTPEALGDALDDDGRTTRGHRLYDRRRAPGPGAGASHVRQRRHSHVQPRRRPPGRTRTDCDARRCGRSRCSSSTGPRRTARRAFLACSATRSAWSTTRSATCPISRNLGIAAAAGDLVAFLDDDAVPEPRLAGGSSSPRSPTLASRAPAGWCSTTPACGSSGATSSSPRSGEHDFEQAPPLDRFVAPGADPFLYVAGGNSAFRRAALAEVEGYDEEVEYNFDEAEVCLRLLDAGWRLVSLDDAVVHHHNLPSHQRTATAFTDPYFAVKNRVYFGLRHGDGGRVSAGPLASATASSRGCGRARGARGASTPASSRHYLGRADAGYHAGLQAALRGDRRGRTFPPPDAGRVPPVAYPTLPGGRRVALLGAGAEELAAAGHEVHALRIADPPYRIDYDDGVWVHRVPAAPRWLPRSRTPRCARASRRRRRCAPRWTASASGGPLRSWPAPMRRPAARRRRSARSRTRTPPGRGAARRRRRRPRGRRARRAAAARPAPLPARPRGADPRRARRARRRSLRGRRLRRAGRPRARALRARRRPAALRTGMGRRSSSHTSRPPTRRAGVASTPRSSPTCRPLRSRTRARGCAPRGSRTTTPRSRAGCARAGRRRATATRPRRPRSSPRRGPAAPRPSPAPSTCRRPTCAPPRSSARARPHRRAARRPRSSRPPTGSCSAARRSATRRLGRPRWRRTGRGGRRSSVTLAGSPRGGGARIPRTAVRRRSAQPALRPGRRPARPARAPRRGPAAAAVR